MSDDRKEQRSGRMKKDVSDPGAFAKFVRERAQEAQANQTAKPKVEDRHAKAEWGFLKNTTYYDNISKWISNDDAEWAKDIGIYVYPTGYTQEEGIIILAPHLYRTLEASLPADKDLTAQDVVMGILNSLVSFKPDFESKDLIRAFALISSEIRLQHFPHLIKLPPNEP